jgi:predicted enzyme related to lactoylglutathione lyase
MKTINANLVLTALAVKNVEISAKFYKSVFDWSISFEIPELLVNFVLPNGMDLMLYQREAYAKNTNRLPEIIPANSISGTELYFHIDDIEEAVSRLREAGAEELSGLSPRDWGDEAAYFADLDGNVLVIARPLK